MKLRKWEELPDFLRTEAVWPYYQALAEKRGSLIWKRCFDVGAALALLILLWPVLLLLAAAVKLDSPGPVFYRQVRVTQYGRAFRIFKFRTMVENTAAQVTVSGDPRITRVGKFIRKCRLDETGQLLNVLTGDMTFVGTRPEVPKFVAAYTPRMLATLLLPAGITSEASIRYKDEDRILARAEDPESAYIAHVLPEKMRYNLNSLIRFGFLRDLATMGRTVLAVLGKNYPPLPAGEEEVSRRGK